MPQLFLALDGRIDFVKKTNPFGSAPEQKKAADPAALAEATKAMEAIKTKAATQLGKFTHG